MTDHRSIVISFTEHPAIRFLRICLGLMLACGLSSHVCGQQEMQEMRPQLIGIAPVQSEPLPTPAPAVAGGGPITLEQLEQKALASNPSLHRLAALVEAARGNWVQVGLAPNPSVGYEGQQLGSGGLAEQHGVAFSQDIVIGGKLRLNRAVAERERMQAEQEFAAQTQRVLTDVRIAFFEVLLAQRQIDVTDNLIRISDEGSHAVESLHRAKEVGRADVLQAQIESENARILAQNARNRYDSAWRNLTTVIGEPILPPQPLVGDPVAPPKQFEFQDALARLLAQSPEITAAAADADRARLAVERARAEPIPNISFQGLVNLIDNGIGGKPDGGVAVSVPVPIFNRNQGAIARAEHEYVATREAISQVQLDLQNRLAPTFERYANSRNQVQRYQEVILPAAQQSLSLTRQAYGAGESNYTSLLTAQRTYAQTELNYLDAIRALRTSEIEIEGMLLRGSLQSTSAKPRSGD